MDVVALPVTARDKSIKARTLLKQDLIPVEYYGNGVENKSFQVDYQTFRKALRKAGSNTIVELDVSGKEKYNVLIHKVQRDPVTDKMMHVDLINVKMSEKLRTKVELNFVGIAPAVKELGGTLIPLVSEVEIECLPKDLIHGIDVDVSSLVDFHSSIKVSDLIVPSTITVINAPDEVIANCSAPRDEVEEPIAEGTGAEAAAPKPVEEGK